MSSVEKMRSDSRIPSLDGIRAIAILMVIALHLCQRLDLMDHNSPIGLLRYFLFGLGGDGVGIFFVLSGFLITHLLLKEHDAKGHINLGDFYLRRTFRILPPLYAYLIFVVVFCIVTHYPLHSDTILGSAFFYRNYLPGNSQWITEHTWSLCVEEQFYLLWPLILILALWRGGKSAAAKVAVCLIALTPFLRVAHKLLGFNLKVGGLLHTRMDALMCGCLLALLIGTPKFEAFYARFEKVWWIAPLWFLLLTGACYILFGVYFRNTIGYTLDSICIALFIVWAIRNQNSWVGRILNSRPMVRIGVLSYSFYLWQTFFIHKNNPTWLNHFPGALGFIVIAGLLSWHFVEQPMLRLRKTLEQEKRRPAPVS